MFRAHIKHEKVNYVMENFFYANFLNVYKPFEHITCHSTVFRGPICNL